MIMPTNRNKRSRYSKPSLSKEILDYLESGITEGETIELYAIRTNKSRLQTTWAEHREQILEKFIRKFPGYRPFCWWSLDAQEPRKRIGGKGLPSWERGLSVKPYYDMGIPTDWSYFENNKVQSFDRADPPTFESECAYLQRHSMLTSIEEKILADYPEAFLPVAITDIFDFTEV